MKKVSLKNLVEKRKIENQNTRKNSIKMKVSLKEMLDAKKKKNEVDNVDDIYVKLSENPLPILKSKTEDDIANILRKVSYEYYKGTPVLTDDIFDIIVDYLQKKNPKHPVLKEIGAETFGKKVELPYFMGSLDKVRENESALEKWKAKYSGKSVVSDKLDGNSALLVVKDSKYKLYSRGDGALGQDISHITHLIKNIPKGLTNYAVRGELIISKAKWKVLYEKGKGANARNAVAGVMHSSKPDSELVEAVDFVAYEQIDPRVKLSTAFKSLKEMGFSVVYNEEITSKELNMENLSKILMKRRTDSAYDVDGIVIFHDAEYPIVKGKNPDYAFAFKSILTHEEAEVIVKEVEWNASKDGYLKPIIKFDPVVLAGASIQKATGFNAQFIEKNVIGPGSHIVIIRSGDVIPHVHKILSKASSNKPSMPLPPVEYEWNDTHVDILLKDKSDDADVMVKRMIYFAKTLEMKGVGPGIVERLHSNNINTFKKFINVKVEDLLKIEGFQKKSAEKVVSEIGESIKKANCLTYMVASNLFGRSIAEKKLKLILENFPKIPEGYKPSETELSKVEGIGSITAKQFLEGLPLFFEFMKELGQDCIPMIKEEKVVSSKKSLEGLIVVFTGVRVKELEQEIEARNGKVGSSVSSKTKVVVAKDPSEITGKVKAAKDLDIPVVTVEEFRTKYL
jgi:NAD-dependent DNA ligase